jgi:hypothetical protein
LQCDSAHFVELSNFFGNLDKQTYLLAPPHTMKHHRSEDAMDIQSILNLANEAHTALTLLTEAAEHDSSCLITGISECNRRASSTLADLHARLFRVFMPPLPREGCARLAEAQHTLMGTVFAAALLFPAHTSSVGEHRREELRDLCRMSALLYEATATLPRFVRGKQPPPPDTFRFYAEQNKARAAHALCVLHDERSLFDRALNESLGEIGRALDWAWSALLTLMLQSV